jgi:hypothetical protein
MAFSYETSAATRQQAESLRKKGPAFDAPDPRKGGNDPSEGTIGVLSGAIAHAAPSALMSVAFDPPFEVGEKLRAGGAQLAHRTAASPVTGPWSSTRREPQSEQRRIAVNDPDFM